MSHAAQFLDEAKQVIDGLDVEAIERMATLLEQARERGGRLFILGVGGSAGQRLARRQRLPQDRRHRGLRPDRQRLGADGADQRRGLADRSSSSGCGSAGSSPRT